MQKRTVYSKHIGTRMQRDKGLPYGATLMLNRRVKIGVFMCTQFFFFLVCFMFF